MTTEMTENGAKLFVAKRWIGIRPRVKQTVNQEARPTQVAIASAGGEGKRYELETEQDELDFILGKWPINGKFRDASEDENLSVFFPHHIIKDNLAKALLEGRAYKPTKVPIAYDGLREGDLVGMALGGMGDRMAYAVSRAGEKRGFAIKRIPPIRLKEARGEANEGFDSELLARLVLESPEQFRPLAKRDRALVKLRETNRLRRFLMKDRMACEQRIRASFLGDIFCSEEGQYPEGDIEQLFDYAKASDPLFQAISDKEKKLNKQLAAACAELPIYSEVIVKVKGVKHSIAAPIIGSVQDIGLFPTVGKFKKFCGLHVNADGSFPRQRRGEELGFNPNARQAFFIAGNMFVKVADGFWGMRLRENKVMYRMRHPYPVLVTDAGTEHPLVLGKWKQDKKTGQYEIETDIGIAHCKGKRKFTDGHLHKRAIWRTVTEFAEWLYWKWRTMEGYTAPKPKVVPPEDMGVALPEIEVSGKAPEPPTFPVVEGVPGLGQTAEAVLA
ncbi:MAG: hypothetical protein UW71_C0018G0005 [Parcubacteria group bacterium GW2011_GWB1_44_7]|uniref:Uncharacterized protein n=1 Tax=Candidatus Giovannonibacteria bacterium GW2011_GWA2_45_21 TaxID=1618649 RepID=A0A0G1M8U0_9BACT|nr:MAG: hypothetical protein UW71_C0018G0005 [Parcubacteria group bacterium GW2011_GWB1_44_7]KKU04512.1 MAG: hypothetical protein UX06_C0016G0005 [Candidatus Giovannonibacteria bacterium GW2011_GWA2_45_21]